MSLSDSNGCLSEIRRQAGERRDYPHVSVNALTSLPPSMSTRQCNTVISSHQENNIGTKSGFFNDVH
jgi:hypothetical protein